MTTTNTVIDRKANGQNKGHDLTGVRFHSLVVVKATNRRENGYVIWVARCDCGNLIERPSYRFLRGLKTCGCGPVGRPRIKNNGAHVNALFAHAKLSAQSRNIPWSLTTDVARHLFESDCHYCGISPSERYTHSNLSGTYKANGIDRKDSKLGYTVDNCVSCCWTCNRAKASMTYDSFITWIKLAYKHITR
jgi:hypothetical protein